MKKVGIIHTTPATVASLAGLIRQEIPDLEIVNIVDDSILGDMKENHEVAFVKERWMTYAEILERLGVSAVLSACSTVGEFAEEADKIRKIPVYRIDEAMAEKAVAQADRIAVFATLNSTLEPTVRLIERKAQEAGKSVEIKMVLVEGAYEALMQGKKEEHDRRIAEAVKEQLQKADRIVLAQASMASALESLADAGDKVLTSPLLGIQKLKKDLAAQ